MGFLKRFFSLSSKRSKKSKKGRHDDHVDASGRVVQPEVNDKEATRLLRSSSAHFSVVKEVDYASLPPLPHPIHSIVNTPITTPARSTTSSLQRQGTYTVTVHGRTVHSRTEFPNANPPLREDSQHEAPHRDTDYFDESPTRKRFNPRTVPLTPHDQSRVLRLRRDPSVASLLNMFDDNGRVNSNAFSNSPPVSTPLQEHEVGRQQVKRNGSTLRQLLGAPDSDKAQDDTAMMGDISWAERFLGEHENGSCNSLASSTSPPLETPKDPHPHTLSESHVIMDTAFTIDNSLSDISVNYPTFSSMEVEFSGRTSMDASLDGSLIKESKLPHVPQVHIANPETPHRPATEIFGFLTERKKSLRQQKGQQEHGPERDLPPVPTPTVSDSSSQLKTPMSSANLFSMTPTITTNSSPATTNSDTSSGQIHTATITKLTPVMNPLSRSTDTLNILRPYTPSATHNATFPRYPLSSLSSSTELPVKTDNETDVARRTAVPKQTTGSSSGSSGTQLNGPSRIPRGPRPAPSVASSTTSSHETELAYLQRPTSPSMASSSNARTPIPDVAQKPSRIPKASSNASRPQDSSSAPRSRQHRRTTSRNSTGAAGTISASPSTSDDERPMTPQPQLSAPPKRTIRKPAPVLQDKENSPVTSTAQIQTQPQPEPHSLPKTPKSNPSQSHARMMFDSRNPNMVDGEVPSPASSTDLSPFGRNIMASLRQQKQSSEEARKQHALAYAGFAS